MNKDTFWKRATDATQEHEVDELCIEWLREATDQYGDQGEIAYDLLRVVARIMDINT